MSFPAVLGALPCIGCAASSHPSTRGRQFLELAGHAREAWPPGARHRFLESVHVAHGKIRSDRESCLRYRACRTSDRQGSPESQRKSVAPSGSQTHSRRGASGSSAPGQSRADPCASNKALAPRAPNLDRANRQSAGPKMIGWNHLVEIKRIEKLSLPFLPPPHHPLPR